MAKLGSNIIYLAVVLVVGTVCYWTGSGTADSGLRDKTKQLQSSLDAAIKRESEITERYNDIQKLVDSIKRQSEIISADADGLTKQIESSSDRARQIQDRFDEHKNGF